MKTKYAFVLTMAGIVGMLIWPHMAASQAGSCLTEMFSLQQMQVPSCGLLIGPSYFVPQAIDGLRWPNIVEVRQDRRVDGETGVEFRSGDNYNQWLGGMQVSQAGPGTAYFTFGDHSITINGQVGQPHYWVHPNEAVIATALGGLWVNVNARDESGFYIHPTGTTEFFGAIIGPTITSLQDQITALQQQCAPQ